MEQATNTFNKGLLTDTNPMILGNDTLTDCLNGTLITMNGNEVILLNDMGNRRVDNAYLPAGYEPVGIKEYGGIIYVAAYNPITNRSLIGSFPSPERKMGDEYKNLCGVLDFDDLHNKNTSEDSYFREYTHDNKPTNSLTKELIEYLKQDSILVPLTSDTSLHPGDKFTVYSGDIITNSNKLYTLNEHNTSIPLISNLDNIYDNKVRSSKNRLYTLSLGILNSLNLFVDITESLERWNTNTGELLDTSNLSTLVKFNTGYFIAKNIDSNIIENSTINDSNFISERNKMALNTYAYKLVGPLYLKAVLNHVKNVKYFISGTSNEDNNIAKLKIKASLEYNCPDGLYGGNGDDEYYTYDTEGTNKLDFIFFESDITPELQPNSIIKSSTIYNKLNDTYYFDIIKEYEVNKHGLGNENEYLIKGLLTIPYIYDGFCNNLLLTNNKQIYIKELSLKIEFNIADLGSKNIKTHTWKFNIKNNVLKYGFNAFSDPDSPFENLEMSFVKINDEYFKIGNNYYYIDNDGNIEKIEETVIINNGLDFGDIKNPEFTISLSNIDIPYMDSIPVSEIENNNNYNKRLLYNVVFTYECGGESFICKKAQWFLGTGLFDDEYNKILNFNDITQYEIIPEYHDTVLHIFINKNPNQEEFNTFTGEYFSFTTNDTSEKQLKHKITYDINPVSSPIIELHDNKYPSHILTLIDTYKSNYTIDCEEIILTPIFNNEIVNGSIQDSDIYILEGRTLELYLTYIASLSARHNAKPLKLFRNISECISSNFDSIISNAGFEFYDNGDLRIYKDPIKIDSNGYYYITKSGHSFGLSEVLESAEVGFPSGISNGIKFYKNGSDNMNLYNGMRDYFETFLSIQYGPDGYWKTEDLSLQSNAESAIMVWIEAEEKKWVLLCLIDNNSNNTDQIRLSTLKDQIINYINSLNFYMSVPVENINYGGTFMDHSNAKYTKTISVEIPVQFNYTVEKVYTNPLSSELNGRRINFSIKEPDLDSNNEYKFSKIKNSEKLTIDGTEFESYIVRTLSSFPYYFINPQEETLNVTSVNGEDDVDDVLLYKIIINESTQSASAYEIKNLSNGRRIGKMSAIPNLPYTNGHPVWKYLTNEESNSDIWLFDNAGVLVYENVRMIDKYEVINNNNE